MATLTLQVLTGPSTGRSVVRARGRLLVGRSTSADLRIADEDVQWEHCVVQIGDETVILSPLASGNVLVNDRPVTGPVKLKDRDIVTLSPTSKVRALAPGLRASLAGRWALAAVAALAVLVAALLVIQPTMLLDRDPRDWERHYLVLSRALDRSDLDPRIADDLGRLLEQAWRRDRSGDRLAAAKEYAELASKASSAMRRVPAKAECQIALDSLASDPSRRVARTEVSAALHGFAQDRSRILKRG